MRTFTKALVIFFLLFLLNSLYGQKVVIVDITYDGWTDTGVDIIAGQKLTILSYGFASTSGKTEPQVVERWGSPSGTSFSRSGLADQTGLAPGIIWQSLVGKIRSSGTPFYVAEAYSQSATQSGRLYLGYNDQRGLSFTDNFGYFVSFVFTPSTLQVSVSESGSAEPPTFSLEQNFPNPFNVQTEIRYKLSENGRTRIKIFNIMGQEIKTLLDDEQLQGEYSIIWDGKDAKGNPSPSGQYYYQISQKEKMGAKKLIILK